ncbi:tRNA dihydrouridine(16) synthase DusC [Pseudoalteromonas ruthenica]|uniref:tRNA-dihydrouridine(16) synthase n=1 Tax=Pseudoalteromonas ruthenica TaxID=151081 RepID=A0A5S3Z7E1_9GAMM|nr:tRNA-dihydrouridine synthase [Pseudoalteromonas ruthenica]TMP87497.1 tRNA dihydrouridine(16) synthase DusC [Pseudoalteromonas ruthenica]
MKLILAPMEGVVDFKMRQLLTDIGGFDLCVTEFVRVVNQRLPRRVFLRYCPELLNGGYTRAGTPVRIQLLGQHPQCLAENAIKAIELGSHGIDLNFGCPAKTVNKSKGGAVLLKEPEQLYQIVKTVREAVAQEHKVTAKVRLGFDDTSRSSEIFDAVVQAGADSIAIHARTKRDGYRPPAYWHLLAPLVQRNADIEIVANGEIWSLDDAHSARNQSLCQHLMLGRGALAMPDLAAWIKAADQNKIHEKMTWHDVLYHIIHSSMHDDDTKAKRYFANRTKQWLGYLRRTYHQADQLFDDIRRLHDKEEVLAQLQCHAQR